MRMYAKLFGFASFVALTLHPPATAQTGDAPATFTPSSDWRVERMEDRCQLTRLFGEDEEQMRMTLEKGGPDATFNLTLIGDAVKNPVGPIISLRFGAQEEAFGRTYITAATGDGRPVIILYGASFTASIPNEEGGYDFPETDAARLAAMDYLEVERAGLSPFRLGFPRGLAAPMDDMAECAKSLEGALSAAPRGQSRAPEPVGNPGRWMTAQDYPAMMLNYRKEGAVKFRLTVNEDGRPVFCTIESTSLPQMFDDAVCLALMRKARFEPARDWEGNPAPSYWRSGVQFVIRGVR